MQLLVPEDEASRQALVAHLAGIKGPAASQGLAKIALFDLSDELRRSAAAALRGRPRDEYREVLLRGLRYVPPAARPRLSSTARLHRAPSYVPT
jgi:hypothetical protein